MSENNETGPSGYGRWLDAPGDANYDDPATWRELNPLNPFIGDTLAAEIAPEVPEDTPDPDEARVRRYAHLIGGVLGCSQEMVRGVSTINEPDGAHCARHHGEWTPLGCPVTVRAVRAIAREEQAALIARGLDFLERAEAAEVEVERLTRECLDREATETDARERLRRVDALHQPWEGNRAIMCRECGDDWPCPTSRALAL